MNQHLREIPKIMIQLVQLDSATKIRNKLSSLRPVFKECPIFGNRSQMRYTGSTILLNFRTSSICWFLFQLRHCPLSPSSGKFIDYNKQTSGIQNRFKQIRKSRSEHMRLLSLNKQIKDDNNEQISDVK